MDLFGLWELTFQLVHVLGWIKIDNPRHHFDYIYEWLHWVLGFVHEKGTDGGLWTLKESDSDWTSPDHSTISFSMEHDKSWEDI
jgi:hypothetical protein